MAKILLGFIVAASVMGCASHAAPRPEVLRPMATLPPGMTSPPVVSVIGYSIQRRPIEMRCFGDGPHPVLILGAIHGNETGAATLAHGFAEALAKEPRLASGVPVAIIPIA